MLDTSTKQLQSNGCRVPRSGTHGVQWRHLYKIIILLPLIPRDEFSFIVVETLSLFLFSERHENRWKSKVDWNWWIIDARFSSTPTGLEDVSRYPQLLATLLEDPTWTEDDIKKLAGLNLLRVFAKVEQVGWIFFFFFLSLNWLNLRRWMGNKLEIFL